MKSAVLVEMASVKVDGDSPPGGASLDAGIKSKAAWIAASAWASTPASTDPSFRMSRRLSSAWIWSKTATDETVRPVEESAGSGTCRGERGGPAADAMGATIVAALERLPVSF